MVIQWSFDGHSMVIQWSFNSHSMAIQWSFNCNTINDGRRPNDAKQMTINDSSANDAEGK